MCHVVRNNSSAIKSDRVKIAFILALFYWTKPLSDERGEKPERPEKTPDDELQKMPHPTVQKFKPKARLESARKH